MNPVGQISSATLPLNRNFSELKARGVALIKQLSGDEWTHFNESDPGVTILDQLCYALTELGYCNHFSIEDILCQSDGKIAFDQQFFQPAKILTTAAITVDDHRKLIIDAIPAVKNAYIKPDPLTRNFTVSLVSDETRLAKLKYQQQQVMQLQALPQTKLPQTTVSTPAQLLVTAVERLLSQHRHLGQIPATVSLLTEQPITLQGTVYLDKQAVPAQVLAHIQLAVDEYVCGVIDQLGYQDMLALGDDSDTIFNGPELTRGWIPDKALKADKRTSVSADELLRIMAKLTGINGVDGLVLVDADKTLTQVNIDDKHVAKIMIDSLVLNQHGVPVKAISADSLSIDLKQLKNQHHAVKIGATIDLSPPLPQGNYRNISEYYSVQNTFPAFYGIGVEGLPATASNTRIAQARQLKGYLMVFDQLLANQFSQLANVAELFSFKPGDTWSTPPSASASASLPATSYGKQLFAPTYYCQPLYQIPNVKPLLISNDSYDYSYASEDQAAGQQQAWQLYQQDPFNPYVSGLRDYMDSDEHSDQRREQMLNHLLARHGECPELYDALITVAHWYGSVQKSRIIIKSRLLQNYQLLSYYRYQGYSSRSADKLPLPGRFRLTPGGFKQLKLRGMDSQVMAVLAECIDIDYNLPDSLSVVVRNIVPDGLTLEQDQLLIAVVSDQDFYTDGQLERHAPGATGVWQAADFARFCSFELRVNLVLGLTLHYQRVAALLLALIHSVSQGTSGQKSGQKNGFTDWLGQKTPEVNFVFDDQGPIITVIRHETAGKTQDHIALDGQILLTISAAEPGQLPDIALYQAHKNQLDWLISQRQGFILLENELLGLFWLGAPGNKLVRQSARSHLLQCQSLFPNYLSRIATAAFTQQFELMVSAFLPVYISNQFVGLSFAELDKVIPDFVKQHNALRETELTVQEQAK